MFLYRRIFYAKVPVRVLSRVRAAAAGVRSLHQTRTDRARRMPAAEAVQLCCKCKFTPVAMLRWYSIPCDLCTFSDKDEQRPLLLSQVDSNEVLRFQLRAVRGPKTFHSISPA